MPNKLYITKPSLTIYAKLYSFVTPRMFNKITENIKKSGNMTKQWYFSLNDMKHLMDILK